MRVPLSWLGEYVDIAPGTTPEEVLEALVRVGFEEEDVHTFSLQGPIVVGQVLDILEEPQSNGKTIRWCQVQVAPEGEPAADGGDAVHGIVCGAANFFVGDKVVVTLPGAELPGPFPIAARKTYGHVSDGMIASARELGLGNEHEGILRLAELGLDPEVGADAIALLGLDDVAVEINVTTDRGYALSMRGVAREYAHATGARFTDPGDRAWDEVQPGTGFALAIEDSAPVRERVGATEFVARVVRGVDPSAVTPAWMIARLTLAGIRSISLLVDITNYVMLELGQPLHGYDLDKLTGGITVRRAAKGETLVTLDEQTRKLHPEDLLITDESGPIGLAGVMGGAKTEMDAETRDVLIEAAVFDPITVARTARRHKLPSEASKRFIRGVDPIIPFVAAQRAVDLMVELAGGTADPLGGLIGTEVFVAAIELPRHFVPELIGVDYTDAEITGALETIGCSVEARPESWEVIPPTWRPDLTDKWTLAEEVARIEGYDRIGSWLPTPPAGRGLTAAQLARRRVSNALAAAGYTETPSFPFTTAELNALFGSADGSPVASIKLANPLDGLAPLLRRSLLPGLMAVAHRNLARGFTDLSLFESNAVFLPELGVTYGTAEVPPAATRPDPETITALAAAIPPQPRHVAVLLLGSLVPKQAGQPPLATGIADALDAVRTIASAIGVQIDVTQGTHAALHPGRTGILSIEGETVGFVGELLPALAVDADLPSRVAVAELDLDRAIAFAGRAVTAATLSTFTPATQDVSLVVPVETTAAQVREALFAGAGDLLESVRLVDDYRGEGMPDGSKSVSFALRFRAPDRTLTAAEASEAKLAGVATASERFGARIRD